jgi:hypothetical protein
MFRRLAILPLLASTACATSYLPPALRAPSPSGCYVIVYERPNFEGAGDVLKGPARFPSLEHLSQTNNENWRNRIRSLRLGAAATLTAYTDRGFEGEARRFPSRTEQPRLEPAFAGRIQSLEVTCDGKTVTPYVFPDARARPRHSRYSPAR